MSESSADLIPAPIFVIYGITGDLSKRKLLPALYHLLKTRDLKHNFQIIGISRSQHTTAEIEDDLKSHIKNEYDQIDEEVFEKFIDSIRFLQCDIANTKDFGKLKSLIKDTENRDNICYPVIHYLAVPPDLFTTIVDGLAVSKLNRGCSHGKHNTRLLIEKPFGYDYDSAKKLNDSMEGKFEESQIYRIDHYLAKDTIKNIAVFRFQNPLFKNIWSCDFISHIWVSAAEEIGVGWRADFYEKTGALRDMLQSHLLQLLALLTMEEPVDLDSDHIHAARLDLLKSIKPLTEEECDTHAVRGQYGADKKKGIKPYRDEVDNPESMTETFAALKLGIGHTRWHDTEFVISSGKRLAKKWTEAIVIFNDRTSKSTSANSLHFHLQPDEGINLRLVARKPGLGNNTHPISMDFDYEDSGLNIEYTAYEQLLVDAMKDDQTNFPSSDEVLTNWKLIDPLLKYWSTDKDGLKIYKPGSDGPLFADKIMP